MTLPIILFGVAALGGIVLAIMRFSGKEQPPMALALIHGAVAAAGLVALIITITGGGTPSMATTALITFVIAAVIGFVVFSFHVRRKALPIPGVAIHALVAVIAFVMLILAFMSVKA